jgi:hypothetical protein
MPIGDSITAGAGAPNGYRKLLQDQLALQVITFTYCGQSTDGSVNMSDPWHEVAPRHARDAPARQDLTENLEDLLLRISFRPAMFVSYFERGTD